jgi:hypothetical protein
MVLSRSIWAIRKENIMAHKITTQEKDVAKTWWYQKMVEDGASQEQLDNAKKIHDNYWKGE